MEKGRLLLVIVLPVTPSNTYIYICIHTNTYMWFQSLVHPFEQCCAHGSILFYFSFAEECALGCDDLLQAPAMLVHVTH